MLDRSIQPVAAAVNDVPTVRIASIRWMTALCLKSWLPEHRRGTEPIAVAGLVLPRRVGVTLPADALRVFCLAPGKWLVLSHESLAELRSQLHPALRQQGIAVTDWSDAFATFTLAGYMARNLLSKGCGLDLDARAFPRGRCARTRFAQVPVILRCLDGSSFELAVARSYSNYLHEWLIDATAEWGNIASI